MPNIVNNNLLKDNAKKDDLCQSVDECAGKSDRF